MEWDGETAHQRFWRSLLNTRLDQLLANREELKALRFNWELLVTLKEKLRLVLEERGMSLESLVAKACDENWDSEDEEKHAPKKCSPVKVKEPPSNHAVCLGPARKSGLRKGQGQGHVLQAGDDCSQILLQKRRCIEARLRRFAQT